VPGAHSWRFGERPLPEPVFRLHVVPAQGEPFDKLFEDESVVIGRASDSGIVVSDRFLSRHHARLFREGAQVLLEDMGSRNGTVLNGSPVERPKQIAPGDVIKMCGSVISVHSGDDGSSATARRRDTASLGDRTLFLKASDLLKESSSSVEQVPADALRRYAERLKLLNEVHQALASSLELDDLLELILDGAFKHLEPEEGVIFLKDAQDEELYQAASRSLPGISRDFLYSRSLIREVTEKGLAALVKDAQTDERFAEAQSILASGVRSLVAAPLQDPDGAVGMIALTSRAQVRQFSEEDLELLVSLASVAAMRLRNVALAREAVERKRLEEELALARRIQVTLLPDRLPTVDGYQLHGGNTASRTVSGDLYQVVTREEGRECVLMVADVSGKGIAASLLTASLEALAAGPIEAGLPPDDICTRLSRRLFLRTPPEKYATAFLAVLEPATGRLTYTNAGHNPAVVVRSGGAVDKLEATGTPIGLIPGATYSAEELSLQAGDTLAIYTDGITEAADPDDEEFGLERLTRVLVEHRGAELDALRSRLETELEGFVRGVPYADDRTMVLLRRT
jgi:sigma-B regulation protein RsbU (phosphoserine phosphatase)